MAQKSMDYVYTILSCCDDILESSDAQQIRLFMMVQKLKSITLPVPDAVEMKGNALVVLVKKVVRKFVRWFLAPLYIHQHQTQMIITACLEEIETQLHSKS